MHSTTTVQHIINILLCEKKLSQDPEEYYKNI